MHSNSGTSLSSLAWHSGEDSKIKKEMRRLFISKRLKLLWMFEGRTWLHKATKHWTKSFTTILRITSFIQCIVYQEFSAVSAKLSPSELSVDWLYRSRGDWFRPNELGPTARNGKLVGIVTYDVPSLWWTWNPWFLYTPPQQIQEY